MRSIKETQLLGELLNFHLGRSIERYGTMSRHTEVADRIRSLRAKRDARYDAMDTRLDAHESKSDEVFRAYEGVIESDEAEVKAMEDEIRYDFLTNTAKTGETDNKVTKFPAGDSTTKTGTD